MSTTKNPVVGSDKHTGRLTNSSLQVLLGESTFQDVLEVLKTPVYRFLQASTPTEADADDAYQVFSIRFAAKLQEIRDSEKPFTFVMVLAQHTMLDLRRKRTRRAETSGSALEQQPASSQGSIGPTQRAKVRHLIDSLPEEDRRILVLKSQGFKWGEIAEILELDITEDAMRMKGARLIARVRKAALALGIEQPTKGAHGG